MRSGLRGPSQRRQDPRLNSRPAPNGVWISRVPRGNGESEANGEKGRKGFNCGMGDHLRFNCLCPKPAKQSEAHGHKSVAALTVDSKSVDSLLERIKELKCQLHAAEFMSAVGDASSV